MARQVIGIGTTLGDHTGDDGRATFNKVNANFTELYAPRTTATGDGSTDDRAAIFSDNAGGNPILFFRGTFRISSDLTLTVPVVFEPGAKFSVDSGKIVTINGLVYAGHQRIFSGAGSVGGSFGGDEIEAEWFGAVPDYVPATGAGTDNTAAINAALNARTYVPVAVGFNATISGTTLTIAGGYMGVIVNGSALNGAGVTGGTTIVSGSGLVWTVSTSQTVNALTPMTSTPTAAATYGRGTVTLQCGLFWCTDDINIPDGIELEGRGKYSTMLCAKPNDSYANSLLRFASTSGLYFTTMRRISVQCPLGGSSATGISVADTAVSSYLEDFSVTGFTGSGGFGVKTNSTNGMIRNGIIDQCESGWQHEGAGWQGGDVTIYGCKYGWRANNLSSQNLWSTFTNIQAYSSAALGFDIGAGKYLKLIGCGDSESRLDYAATATMKIYGSSHDIDVQNYDAVMDNSTGGFASGATASGIWVSGASYNIQISGGSSTHWQNGLYIDTSGKNISVNGGNYSNNAILGVSASQWSGPFLTLNGIQTVDNGQYAAGWNGACASAGMMTVQTSTNVATFTGVIAGNALTVSNVAGTIQVGAYVYGQNVAAGTTITGGSGLLWTVSVPQTSASSAMSAQNTGSPIAPGMTLTGGVTGGTSIASVDVTRMSLGLTGNSNTFGSTAITGLTYGNGIVVNTPATSPQVLVLTNNAGGSSGAVTLQYSAQYIGTVTGIASGNAGGNTCGNAANSVFGSLTRATNGNFG